MAEKIKLLRDWMEEHGVDAYVVPHADRFQSEYLAARDDALAWLTGFTGSAGMAVVAHAKAALFVDGRYTLQAPQQVNTKIYEIYETPHARPMQWLEKRLSSGDTIGMDPWLFTVAQARVWEKYAAERGWHVQWLDHNPMDVIWTDRVADKKAPANAHPVKYAGKKAADKIASVIKKMAPGAERLLVADPLLVCWLLNIRGRDVAHTPVLQSLALVDLDGGVTLFTDPDKITPSLRKVLGNHVAVEHLDKLLATLKLNQKPLHIDPSQAPKAVTDFCKKNNIALHEVEDPCVALRAAKNTVEIAGAIAAHKVDAASFTKFRAWFGKQNFTKTKITELDIVEKLHVARAKHPDFVETSFDTIAGFAGNGAIVHYRADEKSNKRLKPGNLLLLDSGAQYAYGTTDVTRVLAVGKPTAAMKKHYTAVLRGLIALSVARFPRGTVGSQLDVLARAPIWALGLDYAHGTGHGVGSFLSVHEGPQSLSPRGTVALVPGMILSIEPGIYLNGEYGIRLENLVVVVSDTKKGDKKEMLAFKTLTSIPFEKTLIDTKSLGKDEKVFLRGFGLRF